MSDDDRTADASANRLIHEKSPYLLQHAYNPVDWYPWGEEAFERASAADLPVFLSIGYATCHWCHVMERESFEDDEVAALLNEQFVPIKLDREERPDLDGVYMTVCQLMTGSGGWPLTVVMTPDKQPFFAGTYFPKHGGGGRPGMMELLPRLSGLWRDRRSELIESGAAALAAVREVETRGFASDPDARLDARTLERGFDELSARFDETQGGFGRAPKFPTPHQLLFLLRWHHRSGDERALHMVEKTLVHMRRGGVFDHVGYGFHRYATDARWLVPHFEKMLYDQALLLMAYVELWRVTGRDEHRRVAEEIIEYALRDLRDAGGAFYSAEDADSEGREGAFYVWTREELDERIGTELGEGEAALARRVFQIETRGNFADEATGVRTGENILHRRESIEELAAALDESPESLSERLERIRITLFRARSNRERPLLDDKVLTDWNGLIIAALAQAGRAFDEPEYVAVAERATRFILTTLRGSDGRLLHRFRDGEAAIAAGAADYAYMAWGLLDLYTATFDPVWLEGAIEMAENLIERFWDEGAAGVFNADADQLDVPVRQKEVYDGATPSANAAAWLVLTRLGRLTASPEWIERATRLGEALAGPVSKNPSAHTMSLVALDLTLGPAHEIVVVANGRDDGARPFLEALNRGFRPRDSILLRRVGEDANAARLDRLAPFTAGHDVVDGTATVYVCADFACQRPTSDASEMLRLLI
ncbi:MAG: thioredoxin domain-containing protein [Gemmatimonadetes bacterium]|nr:thioredoxin domain-containing protein [Gemmatimonadota bacterium]